MKYIIFILFFILILCCQKENITEPNNYDWEDPENPSPIPMAIDNFWVYAIDESDMDTRFELKIIDYILINNKFGFKIKWTLFNYGSTDTLTTENAWIWDPPLFKIYNQNNNGEYQENRALKYPSEIGEIISWGSERTVLIHNDSTFTEDGTSYDHCLFYHLLDVSGVFDFMNIINTDIGFIKYSLYDILRYYNLRKIPEDISQIHLIDYHVN